MVNGHGTEQLHTDMIPLEDNEQIIMLCNWGCGLIVKDLFTKFIYAHVSRCKNSSELITLLTNPTSKGKCYKPLDFIKRIMCLYVDNVPEMYFDYSDRSFRSAFMELPVSPRLSAKVLGSMKPIILDSYIDDSIRLSGSLSTIITRLRKIHGDEGFTIALFVCRDFESNLKSTKLTLLT